PLCIGNVRYNGVNTHSYNETDEFFRGKIDEIRIYDYALSAEQIENIYAQLASNASYSFSEGTGTITADDSGTGNDGIIHGAAWTTGKVSYGLHFDGINDWVEVADDPSLDLIDQITVEAWVNLDDLTDGGIIGKYDNYSYYNYCLWLENGFLYFEIGNRTTDYFEKKVVYGGLNTGTWYHIVGTYDRQNVKLYVNAINRDTEPETREMGTGGGPLCIGNVRYNGVNTHSYNETDEFFRGRIDEVRIYDYALSAEQVYSRYISF
ncbi:MAG: LamG-like jellyroll fold domain-containing protein, partial [bacterium]